MNQDMDALSASYSTHTAPVFRKNKTTAHQNLIPTSSPAFSTPVHPIRVIKPPEVPKPSILPILLPPATLRPLAFRTLTKKHDLTLTSSALQLFATFIGKQCGSGWREEGLAEKVLDEAAKIWKQSGGGVIIPGEGDGLKNVLRTVEGSMSGGKASSRSALSQSNSLAFVESNESAAPLNATTNSLSREESQMGLGMSSFDVEDEDNTSERKDPRQWLKVIGAFEHPMLTYNINLKHFEPSNTTLSPLPNPSHKTQIFRHRYSLIHQRLLRNESFQTSSVANARTGTLQRCFPNMATIQKAYKLTPVANLLGRTGSSHLLLGLLTISPTGNLTLNDLTGSIGLDILHARPIPEDGAWFSPGMIVLVDGVYEEEGSSLGPGLDGNRGVGGTIGGKFIAFSIGGPPCERREVTLGVVRPDKNANPSTGGGFGWVDFLGVGSEKAIGTAMRKLELEVLNQRAAESSLDGRSRIIILGEVQLDNARTLQALSKILGLYAVDELDQTPMVVVLMGNFVRYAVMTGGVSGGSIEYKEYFDSLASALSDYPTMLQNTTFVFVPGDTDPWASAFSAGAATVLPRDTVPELFTSRVKRAFAIANAEAEKTMGKKTDGKAVWSTNPTRLSLFGPTHEMVLFRDDMSARLRRTAVRFRRPEGDAINGAESLKRVRQDRESSAAGQGQDPSEGMEIDGTVQTAESHIPAPKAKEAANSSVATDLSTARKLVKTILDQGYMSPFPLSDRPVLWDYSGALQLYPLPTALVLMDPEAPPFAVTYEGCHVMNPGSLIPSGRGAAAQWMEYSAKTRRGRTREIRF